jgi:hypothetical protein
MVDGAHNAIPNRFDAFDAEQAAAASDER